MNKYVEILQEQNVFKGSEITVPTTRFTKAGFHFYLRNDMIRFSIEDDCSLFMVRIRVEYM